MQFDLHDKNNNIGHNMSFWNNFTKRTQTFKSKMTFRFKTILHNRRSLYKWIFGINVAALILTVFMREDRSELLAAEVKYYSELELPKFLRSPIYSLYAKIYNTNLKEVQLPLHKYPTFSSFFTRKINRQAPPQQPNTISSPCDGKILSFEEVIEDKCNIIKGHKYSLTELMIGSSKDIKCEPVHTFIRKDKNNKLYQIIIYLAPGDYHRFHAPADIKILKEKRIEGGYKSVSEKNILKGQKIYEENKRVCLFNEWKQGMLAMVLVGALNVGRINLANKTILKRGQELGYFNLGSTIVMVVESKGVKQWRVKQGDTVKYGEPLLQYQP